jgi:hypothetical protein
MSMGYTRAWRLAAIDDRVKTIVGVACFTRYTELIARQHRPSVAGEPPCARYHGRRAIRAKDMILLATTRRQR